MQPETPANKHVHAHKHTTHDNMKFATCTFTYRHIGVTEIVSCCFFLLTEFLVYAAVACAFAVRAQSGMFCRKSDRTADYLLELGLSLLHMYHGDTT